MATKELMLDQATLIKIRLGQPLDSFFVSIFTQAGWQKLAGFQRTQKMPLILS